MAIIASGPKIAKSIYSRLGKRVANLKKKKITPKLGVILVGDDKPSERYVLKKGQAAKKLGVGFILKKYPAGITTTKLIDEVKKIQQKKYGLTGLIVQLPLPEHIKTGKVLEAISPKIDVDCLTQTNLGKLITWSYKIKPPTPDAILEILKYYKVKLRGKNIVMVGAGDLVGKPVTNLLIHEEATVTVCNKFTKNLKQYTSKADIVITGVGKYKLLKGSMIKKGAVVIDAGISFHKGIMRGDIDYNSIVKKAKIVTPTPGGVGPLTVAKLIENTVICAEKLNK